MAVSTGYDLIVLGSGFAGSIMAWIGARSGKRVLLIERGQHPRFVIGESSTPMAALILEELAHQYRIPELIPFTRWGEWRTQHPDIAVGLKRGFAFYHHDWGQSWQPSPDRSNELLVAASPHDAIADTHWYRPDFDHFLVKAAIQSGVTYLDRSHVSQVTLNNHFVEIEIEPLPNTDRPLSPFPQNPTDTCSDHGLLSSNPVFHTGTLRVRTEFILDATNRGMALGKHLGLTRLPLDHFPDTISCFGHFSHVNRWSTLHAHSKVSSQMPPFCPDDAALHHVFPGGWFWMLPFSNGITSAGFMLTRDRARELGMNPDNPMSMGAREVASFPQRAWDRVLNGLPSVQAQFQNAQVAVPLQFLSDVAFRMDQVAGHRWALLPGSAGFVDPLLSTGFPLTLLGIQRLAGQLFGRTEDKVPDLSGYQAQTRLELDRTTTLIGALYKTLSDPPAFHAILSIYFAAASFGEVSRRLGKSDQARGFLMANHDEAWLKWEECCRLAGHVPTGDLTRKVYQAIERWNLAGLGEGIRKNWYPCLAQDLHVNRNKIGALPEEIERMLQRSGFDS